MLKHPPSASIFSEIENRQTAHMPPPKTKELSSYETPPLKGRKHFSGNAEVVPGAPRARLISGSSSSKIGFEEHVDFIGAPRLNLSQSGFSDDEISVIGALQERHTPFFDSLVPLQTSTPGPVSRAGIQPGESSILSPRDESIISQGQKGSIRLSVVGFRCRICYDEESENEPLISPCRCKGTVGLLHKSCLERWLQVSQTIKCEICGYAYILRSKQPLDALESPKTTATMVIGRINFFRDWFNSHRVRRHLATDLAFFLLLIPTTALGLYFCITSMQHFNTSSPYAWQIVALLTIAVTLVLILIAWVILAGRHHLAAYFIHRQSRESGIREAYRRRVLERNWRFSVHPRPRGSSFAGIPGWPTASRRPQGSAASSDSTSPSVAAPALHLYTLAEAAEAGSASEPSTPNVVQI